MIKLKPGLPHGRHQAKLLINPKLTTAIQIRQLGEQFIFFNLNVFVGSSAVHDEMFQETIISKNIYDQCIIGSWVIQIILWSH